MARMARQYFLWGIVLYLLAGCSSIQSHVTVFHVLPESPPQTKYAFLPLEGQGESLEYATYKGLIRAELSKRQFEEVPLNDATVVVAFTYSIGEGKEKLTSVPIFGQTGVSSSHTTGTVHTYGGYGTYSGTTTYTPRYGITGVGTFSDTEYMRRLRLHIVDKASLDAGKVKVLYEADVASEGSSSQIAAVMPTMIRALFKEFPGKSGSTRKEVMSP